MTSNDRKIIYNLLKTASSHLYGYESPEFMQDSAKNTPYEKDALTDAGANTVPPEKNSFTDEKNSFTDKPESTASETGSATMRMISEKIRSCRACPLHERRKNAVVGAGPENPYVMVIGEAPGEEEDGAALPFVGPAGKLLDRMLNSILLDRNYNCYIANTVKCRPPMNRDPQKSEADACRSFLDAQIHILKPRFILTVGKVALKNLMRIDGDFSLSAYRQRLLSYNGVPVAATYHPSALLRSPEYKKPAWEDLKFLRAELEKNFPEYKNSFVPKF